MKSPDTGKQKKGRSESGSVAKSLKLCAVTDRHWIDGPGAKTATSREQFTLAQQVEQAIAGGATMIQLREKNLDTDAFIELAGNVKKVTDRYRVPLIINDNLEVALACGADGFHIGQDDGDPARIRQKIGSGTILGISVHTAEEALKAENDGADYIGVGAVFPTGSKDDVSVLPIQTISEICAAVRIPAVAIGGINAENARILSGCGIAGIAVISAIFSHPDKVRESAAKLSAIADVICR